MKDVKIVDGNLIIAKMDEEEQARLDAIVAQRGNADKIVSKALSIGLSVLETNYDLD